jgi:hypothetical protein
MVPVCNFILVSLEQTEMNLETGEPLEQLAPATKQWCTDLGCEASTVKDVLSGSNEQVSHECWISSNLTYQVQFIES